MEILVLSPVAWRRHFRFNFMKLNFYFLFFLLTNFCSAQNVSNYYLDLFQKNDIEVPIEFQFKLNVTEIRGLDIKNTNFYTVFHEYVTTKRDSLEVTELGDSLRFYPTRFVSLIYPESDKTYVGDLYYDDKFKYPDITDSVNQYSSYYEVELPHKWNLRNFPFDNQILKIIFRAREDSSIVRLLPSKQFPPKINPERFKYLLDGFNIKNMTTSKEYVESSVIGDYVEGNRPAVYEQLVFNINVDRKGSYLFFKLFFGGFLSFLISYLVFFIDPKYFETRVTLSLGGIFGAVGNKYFVENSMPSLQVLTKADLINNLVIIFIIINIFIVICQFTPKISIWKFETNKFSSIIILALFVLFNFLIVKM